MSRYGGNPPKSASRIVDGILLFHCKLGRGSEVYRLPSMCNVVSWAIEELAKEALETANAS